MPNYYYHQGPNKQDPWKAVTAGARDKTLAEQGSVFCTALAVSSPVEGLEKAQKDKLGYSGAFYLDWDGLDIGHVITKVHAVITKLEEMRVDLEAVSWYATGKKGFHAELPMELFYEGKLPKSGIVGLPWVYKEMVFDLGVDTLDLKIYSHGMGRMWRLPNVRRPDNGMYKVPLTVAEVLAMTPEIYAQVIQAPRTVPLPRKPEFSVDLHLMYARAQEAVSNRLAARKNRKRDPNVKGKAKMPSVKFMMNGEGLKPDAGFHQIAMQVALSAIAAEMTPEQMIAECAGLIVNHVSDSHRYNTTDKRKTELLRLYDYMLDNPGYEFSVPAIKAILIHEAPDLDGLHVGEKEIKEGITEAIVTMAGGETDAPDEYSDVAGGVTMSKFGVYVDTENGKKRVCAISFRNVHLLYSMNTSQLAAYEAEVLVNGRPLGRQTLELDTFATLSTFNKFCARHGHAMQGSEAHVRGLMMRFVEEGKKRGKVLYIAQREGLDIVNIPAHEDPELRKPFMIYATAGNVLVEPRVRASNVSISFQGFPDPRGLYKTDIGDAPPLADWAQDSTNRKNLTSMFRGMFAMQKPDVVAKLLGWYAACFYRMMFHRLYDKFPLLHVNGSAGSGKTAMNLAMASFFYFNQQPKMTSPGSSLFAIKQHVAGSASVPLIIDEYKPQDMHPEMHNQMRLMLRDAYNCREQSKGGGNRESDDFRQLYYTQLAAPICFIAEAAEDESAIAERVVLVTVTKPSSSQALRQVEQFNTFNRHRQCLSIIGQELAAEAIEEYSLERLREEFEVLFNEAKSRFMLGEGDLDRGLSQDVLALKQNSKERSVYNYTVARFGLQKVRAIVEKVLSKATFDQEFDALEEAIYGRMADLQSVTQPEWSKVLNTLADMSWNVDPDSPVAIRSGKEYGIVPVGGRDILEVSLRAAYFKYRSFQKGHNSKALFPSDAAFMHAIKDCPALISMNQGDSKVLHMPGVGIFDVERLQQAGVMPFMPPGSKRR